MMTRTLLARCAPLAIAASAALPVMPATAQDAATPQPVIVLPPAETAPVATAPAPSPAIVLPAPAPAVAAPVQTTQAPVAETSTSPAEAVSAPARTTRSTAVRRSAPAAALAAAPAAEAAPSQPVSQSSIDEMTARPITPPATAEIAPTVAEPVAANDSSGTNEVLIAGLLGALGLAAVGGVAFAASRRRRRRAEEMDYDTVEQTYAEQPVAYEAPMVQTHEPARTTPVVPATSFAAAAPAPVMAPATAPGMARNTSAPRANGDPVALPSEVPQTFEERDALLKELVAAEPDRANPFTSVRARARRAKLIMQSLGQDFQNRKPRIDLSEYTNRWPALRGWQPATA